MRLFENGLSVYILMNAGDVDAGAIAANVARIHLSETGRRDQGEPDGSAACTPTHGGAAGERRAGPIIGACKKDLDRTALSENLKLAPRPGRRSCRASSHDRAPARVKPLVAAGCKRC